MFKIQLIQNTNVWNKNDQIYLPIKYGNVHYSCTLLLEVQCYELDVAIRKKVLKGIFTRKLVGRYLHIYYPERSILDSHSQWGLVLLYFFNASWCHKLFVFTLTVQVRLGTKCRASRQKVSKINCKFQTIHELLRYSVELLGHTVYYDDMFDFKGGILEQVEFGISHPAPSCLQVHWSPGWAKLFCQILDSLWAAPCVSNTYDRYKSNFFDNIPRFYNCLGCTSQVFFLKNTCICI